LIFEKAKIVVYDPKVAIDQMLFDLNYLETRSSEKNSKYSHATQDPYAACKDAHAIAILTEWDEFKEYDWKKIYDSMLKPAFIFDGRNILDGQQLEKIGFHYQAIGS
jgi:UDPglucose 6-dehydrogenase